MSATMMAPPVVSTTTMPPKIIMSSSDKDSIEKGSGELEQHAIVVSANHKTLDISLALAGIHDDSELDPADSLRVKRKLDRHLLPLLFLLYTLQFVDKNAIAASSILGFIPDNGLTPEQYNNLATFFYLGVLVSQLPHAFAFQYLPVAKYLSVMIFLWALFVSMHCVANSYAPLVVLRILLGMAEGCITPGIMLISQMFYTRIEMAERLGWNFACNGLAQIVAGFIAYGVVYAPAKTSTNAVKIAQWQIYMVIVSGLTLVASILFAGLFPDSPTKAKFLTEEEKVIVIKRMKSNQAGVETKVFKPHQLWETLKDPKALAFFLWPALGCLLGGISIQYFLVLKAFGFNTLQTTLLTMPGGFAQILGICVGAYALRKFPNSRKTISLIAYIPMFLGGALLLGLPIANRTGLLCSIYLIQFGSQPAIIMSLSWVTCTVSGHTKKLTMNGIWLLGYSLGQMLSPQPWKEEYKPRNAVPWWILMAAWSAQVVIILAFYWHLKRENRKRDERVAQLRAAHPSVDEHAEVHPDLEPYEEYSWVDVSVPGGGTRRERVEKRFLDLTDKENLAFRYVL